MDNKRLIIASNRLPVKIDRLGDDFSVAASAGGLATGLKSYHKGQDSVWIGWPGLEVESAEDESRVEALLAEEHCLPVYLDSVSIENYYDGFSNATLWPLFHYFTDYTRFSEKFWQAYCDVNERFAQTIVDNVQDGDVVWVHDYQLLLVPEMVKRQRPDITIGFFLHIPFPSYEVFRILPWRLELLNGMLGADMIGFHTYDYARHFNSSVKRLLGYDLDFNTISLESRHVYVDVFPMGIDYDKFRDYAVKVQSTPIQERSKQHQDIDRFLLQDPDHHLLLSIDRLDYTKGIPERLRAFKYFLHKYPEFREKVSLILLVVPSRVDVEQYKNLKSEIEELVGGINGEFGSINWTPVVYFYRSLSFESLIELYSSSDVALLTPLRDGMNLVAKEFVATKNNMKGVLILSEMAGASKELGEALIVNPNNIADVSDAIYVALTMSEKDQKAALFTMQKRLKRYDVHMWASEFMKSLYKTQENIERSQARRVSKNLIRKIETDYNDSVRSVFFLDYDGTLQRFFNQPEDAKPDAALMTLLRKVHKAEDTDLVIISGRDKETLGEWFAEEGFNLIAEHGVWHFDNGVWHERNQGHTAWKDSIRPVFESYMDRTPGSLIEEKSHSLVWHYRKSDVELGALRALELTTDLSNYIINQDLEILEGNKVVEIKSAGINKGGAAISFIGDVHYDFILAIGDDWTDEYLFKELPEMATTIKVGTSHSDAKYFVDSYKEVRAFLEKLVN